MMTRTRVQALIVLALGIVVGVTFSPAEGVCLVGTIAILAAYHVTNSPHRRCAHCGRRHLTPHGKA